MYLEKDITVWSSSPHKKKSCLILPKTGNCSSCSTDQLWLSDEDEQEFELWLWQLAFVQMISCVVAFSSIYVYRQEDWGTFRSQCRRGSGLFHGLTGGQQLQKRCSKVIQRPQKGLSLVSFWLSHIADSTERAVTAWDTQAVGSSQLHWTETYLW